MPDHYDERLTTFQRWIDDQSTIIGVVGQVELLEAILSCPYELPAEYLVKLGLPAGATYHDAAKLLLHDRYRTQGNFTLRSLIAVVTTVAVALGTIQLIPYTLRTLQRSPWLGFVLLTGIVVVITTIVVVVWRLAGRALARR